MDYKAGIEELKKRYQNNEVSALIGAGFSKNIYKLFPSWDELLFDMVKELYQSEIENGFHHKLHFYPQQDMNYSRYCNQKITEIINRDGYLYIVSKFWEKKGIRETLETYIEERIPYVNEKDSTLRFLNKDKKIHLKDSDFEVHTKLLEGTWDNIYTTNYDELLEFAAKRAGKNWDIITKAQELSFSKQAMSIIKLHGSLFNPYNCQNNSFEFDGNCHHRYVISKEDYDNYPKEHEAFTQLMRISLLQGTFCLIGFSGNDPNFLSWIRWVRDILVLHNKSNTENTSSIKIFLIDLTADNPSSDKQLFYKNHNIYHIPLLQDEVRNLIGAIETLDPKVLITSFLSYLYDNTYTNTHQYDANIKHQYQNLWRTVYSISPTTRDNVGEVHTNINVSQLDLLYKLKSANRIVNSDIIQDYILSTQNRSQILNDNEIKLILLALKDTFYLPDFYLNLIKKLECHPLIPEQAKSLSELQERSNTLYSIDSEIELLSDSFIYEQVLRYAFSLDFTNLKHLLLKWMPKGTYYLKQAVFLSLFDKEKAKDILIQFIDRELEIKERYYATQLLNLITGSYPQSYSTVKYENQNIDGLYELEEIFINKATKEGENVKPYGYRGKTYHFNVNNSRYKPSLRALQFLIEFPVLLNFQHFEVVKDNDWYKIFRIIFVNFPYPTLFYSIQCHSSDILKRIGQEYAYSDDLYQSKTTDILKRLLKAFVNQDTPNEFLPNILAISKELFVSVKPSLWESDFMIIWRNNILPRYSNLRLHNVEFEFTSEALKYISSKKHITEILVDCIKNEKQNIDITTDFLYHLRASKKNVNNSLYLQEIIAKFISNISEDKEFTISGNIFRLLSPNDINNISIKIKDIIRGENVSDVAFIAISYFTKKSKTNEIIVRQSIINNVKLWDNGISKEGMSRPSYLKLSNFKSNIKWSKNDVRQIYEKLKMSLNQVISSRWYSKNLHDNFWGTSFNSLFEEMYIFLIDNREKLLVEKDYQDVLSKLSIELEKQRGFVDINEALISDDDDTIISGLNQLYRNIITSDISRYETSINLLLDRILLKKQAGLESVFDYLVYYLSRHYSKDNISKNLIDKLLLIIKTYSKNTFSELELETPLATKHLIAIASSLKKLGYLSDSIDYWISIKKSHRFNIS